MSADEFESYVRVVHAIVHPGDSKAASMRAAIEPTMGSRSLGQLSLSSATAASNDYGRLSQGVPPSTTTDGGARTIPSAPVSKAVSFSRSPAPKPDQTGAAGVLPRAARPAARAVAPKPSAPATEPPPSSAPAPAPASAASGLLPPLSFSRNPSKGLADAVDEAAVSSGGRGRRRSRPRPSVAGAGPSVAGAAQAPSPEDDPTPAAPKYDVYGFELKTDADAPKPAEADIETAGPPKYDVYGFPLKGNGLRI